MQLWTVSKLNDLPPDLRRKIRFYAPLLESLDFMGVEPGTFARASTSSAIWRDGSSHSIPNNIPRFEFDGETHIGLFIGAGETLQYSVANELDSADTLIWFENAVPKSTPTNTNPISASGVWAGNLGIHLTHLIKANRTLTNSEINQIQNGVAEIVQTIPPITPTIPVTGQFFYEGLTVAGSVATLSFAPVLASLIVHAHGSDLFRVASSPGNLEYTATGTGSKTITFGLAPAGGVPVFAQYVLA